MILEKEIFVEQKKNLVSRFFSFDSFSPQKIDFGESNNCWEDLAILNKARGVAVAASQEGCMVRLYEKVFNIKEHPDSKKYILYFKKSNKPSLSIGLLNLQSKFTNKIRKVNINFYLLN